MLEPEDLLQIAEFFVISHLLYRSIPNIARLTPEWKHAERVAAYNAQARNSKSLRRVTLRNDKRTLVAPVCSGPVGVVQLGDARNTSFFSPVRLFEFLVDKGQTLGNQVVQDTGGEYILDEFWWKIGCIGNF